MQLPHNADTDNCGDDTPLFLLGVLLAAPLAVFLFSLVRYQILCDRTLYTLGGAVFRNGLHDQILFLSSLGVLVVLLVFAWECLVLLPPLVSFFLAFSAGRLTGVTISV